MNDVPKNSRFTTASASPCASRSRTARSRSRTQPGHAAGSRSSGTPTRPAGSASRSATTTGRASSAVMKIVSLAAGAAEDRQAMSATSILRERVTLTRSAAPGICRSPSSEWFETTFGREPAVSSRRRRSSNRSRETFATDGCEPGLPRAQQYVPATFAPPGLCSGTGGRYRVALTRASAGTRPRTAVPGSDSMADRRPPTESRRRTYHFSRRRPRGRPIPGLDPRERARTTASSRTVTPRSSAGGRTRLECPRVELAPRQPQPVARRPPLAKSGRAWRRPLLTAVCPGYDRQARGRAANLR